MFDLIMDWVLTPLLDMLLRRRVSGKWHMSYMFPIATAVGVILWYLGSHYDIAWLLTMGSLITVICGFISILTFIPMEVGFSRDMKSYQSRKKKETGEQDADSSNKL